jgi:hypothetical protein
MDKNTKLKEGDVVRTRSRGLVIVEDKLIQNVYIGKGLKTGKMVNFSVEEVTEINPKIPKGAKD